MYPSAEEEPSKLPQVKISAKEIIPKSFNPLSRKRNQDESSETSMEPIYHKDSGFDTDLEGGAEPGHRPEDQHIRPSTRDTPRGSDASIWPGQDHWRDKALAAKRKNRYCNLLGRLDRRTRIAVKVALVLLVVGVAVGVGLGISKSLGARVWKPEYDHR
ncbi:hypothetical protein F4802DRAFT_19347 [Xylaria palmicola]|nr:hypothetical protein F4802DRAFT_19347 [Xylaria palmicola]